MLVSIIIPIYNVEAYIAECLQSVMRQTFRDLEVLLVDDCGTDGSLAIVRDMLGGAEEAVIDGVSYRIVHHERNRGLSAARNTGIDAARGEWVFFLDSDDWISENCIEEHVKAMQQADGIETTIAQLETFDDEGHTDISLLSGIRCPQLQMPEGVYSNEIFRKYIAGGFYEMAWNKLIRRDYLIRHELYFQEGLLHEDNLWSFCCVCQLRKVAAIHKTLYHYRIRKESLMSQSMGERKAKAHNSVLCGQIDYAVTHGWATDEQVFNYLFPRVKGYFFNPFYQANRQLIDDLFDKLDTIHFWTYGQLWHLVQARRDFFPYLYRLLPKKLGRWYYRKVGSLVWGR